MASSSSKKAPICLTDELLALLSTITLGELSQQELDELEGKVTYAVSAVRSLRNMTSPVHRLPIEVLCLIFSELHNMERPAGYLPRIQPFQTIDAVASVCKRWRDASLSCPELWSSIYKARGTTHFSLARSGSVPLKIYYRDTVWRWVPTPIPNGWGHPSPPINVDTAARDNSIVFLNTISIQSERIEEIHLLNIDLDVMSETEFITTPMPNLESLTISMNDRYKSGWSAPPTWTLSTLFGGGTPKLRRVALHNSPSFPGHTFQNLTHLFLASQLPMQRMTMANFLQILGASPMIEELAIVDAGPFPDELTHTPVQLAHIRILCLGAMGAAEQVVQLLAYLVIPHHIEFYLWGGSLSGGETLDSIFPLYRTQDTALKAFRITFFPHPHASSTTIWRGSHRYAVFSTPTELQVDGRLDPAQFMFDAPRLLNMHSLEELWIGCEFANEPSIEMWRDFFFALPWLQTLVISRRTSHQIITALTLPKNDTDGELLCPSLENLRIYDDPSLSVLRLSIFAEQRMRRGRPLHLCEVISNGFKSTNRTYSPDAWAAEPSYPLSDGLRSDLMYLEEYIMAVKCDQVLTNPQWDVLSAWPPPVYSWLADPVSLSTW
ncbi:hypothetical protein HGRIS_008962 [Hohenbuehelia grisea]|uniref:F-box domain-containing protein n=1 Tax=Hohenbuehelia grisea TaxID=104357 RepID=A0ABR3J050_9AGAR